MSTTYTTLDEAILREVIEPIEASGEVADARAAYDVHAITGAVMRVRRNDDGNTFGFFCAASVDEFWETVAANEVAA